MAVTVEHLCRHEVDRWLMGTMVDLTRPALKSSTATVSQNGDRTDGADYSHLRVVAERFADSFRLDVDSLIQEVFRHVERNLGGPPNKLFHNRIEQLPIERAQETAGETAALIEQFVAEIDALMGLPASPTRRHSIGPRHFGRLARAVTAAIGAQTRGRHSRVVVGHGG